MMELKIFLSLFCAFNIASAQVPAGKRVAYPAKDFVLAKRVPQSIVPRAAFYGGWALSATTCPNGTDTCGQASVDANGNACCPSNLDCQTSTGIRYCCPNSKQELFIV
jgi:hypothetical protein